MGIYIYPCSSDALATLYEYDIRSFQVPGLSLPIWCSAIRPPQMPDHFPLPSHSAIPGPWDLPDSFNPLTPPQFPGQIPNFGPGPFYIPPKFVSPPPFPVHHEVCSQYELTQPAASTDNSSHDVGNLCPAAGSPSLRISCASTPRSDS